MTISHNKLQTAENIRTLASDEWVKETISLIEADANRSADTHLITIKLSSFPHIDLYLKDESTLPSGSLKHRLARSLFLYGLCNGFIKQNTTIVEASSGSTAISEAYFARLLKLQFIAVVPNTTASEKITAIERLGGTCIKVNGGEIYQHAETIADEKNGYYMDQFTNAERATDWRGNNNIAESLFQQMAREQHPVPDWIVVGAGTGGTAATIGRYLRYRANPFIISRLCVVDPENSVYFDYFKSRDRNLTSYQGSRIEGIGRPRVEPSFIPEVIDRMIKVPDAASIATIWWLKDLLGRDFGPSTGTNVYAVLALMREMKEVNKTGSVVTLICDSGMRYIETCFNQDWLADQKIDIKPYIEQLSTLK